MALRFRSFFPYTLPGVLALIGWWWYTSRKKGRLAERTKEEAAGAGTVLPEACRLPAPSGEGSNGIVEKSCPRQASDRKPQKSKKDAAEEQEVVAEVHTVMAEPPAKEEGPVPSSETLGASLAPSDVGGSVAELDAKAEPALQESRAVPRLLEAAFPHRPKTAEQSLLLQGPGEAGLSAGAPLLEGMQVATAFISAPGKQTTKKDEGKAAVLPASRSKETKISSAAELAEAVRPEPEGEVAADKIAVPFAEELQPGAAKESLSSKGDLHAAPAVEDQSPPSGRKDPPCSEIPAAFVSSCHVASTPAQPPKPGAEGAPEAEGYSRPQENGLPAGLAERRGSIDELERLAAGLITEVISAAAQEVTLVGRRGDAGNGQGCGAAVGEQHSRSAQEDGETGGSCLANGKACMVCDQVKGDEGQTTQEVERSAQERSGAAAALATLTSEGEDTKEEPKGMQAPVCPAARNGSLPPLAEENGISGNSSRWRAERGQKSHSVGLAEGKKEAVPQSLVRLQVEELAAGAEDSGCSTCQSEDGISSEDLLQGTGLSCVVPESKEDLLNDLVVEVASEGQCTGSGSSSEQSPAAAVLPTHRTTCAGRGLNGSSLRNGGHWTNEAEGDHSGGSDVNSMDSVDSGCTLGAGEAKRGTGQPPHPQKSELTIWEIEVPKHLVGRLIGKQGRYVSFLKQSSGAKIYISTLPYTQEFQICHIEGTQQQVDKALGLIGKKFKDLDLTNLYAPPPLPLTLPSLPITSWLMLPSGVTVEVIVVNIVSAGHMFVQQHTHPTYHALRSLDQQMFLCYSQPGIPTLPSPVEVGVICAAPAVEGAWWRAQVIAFYKDSNEVEIRYVDYGGYERVKIDLLRQIRSDFVTLPFQGAEVLLDNIAPLPGEDRFSTEADSALEEMTRGVALLAQVTNYDSSTGLPLIQLWNMVGDELASVNRALVERGLGTWIENF
nr:PREDICTED: A-kinase anchor protein 1, mitochondrial [Lepisosteus oculatus]XP_015223206.1 PREDICTED: A-kinase anchor protein 1, mitochondrial [Lepisosteus oculatus]XP_015223207.1 PREDICTED: A-kinase anchor protein 1, mitochondrial [Lepisosteus oculatus]XP_015223208.1 PREDICTED: A-kinase anchor protein 1, mitochondrial [Lepisosteus oculatus]